MTYRPRMENIVRPWVKDNFVLKENDRPLIVKIGALSDASGSFGLPSNFSRSFSFTLNNDDSEPIEDVPEDPVEDPDKEEPIIADLVYDETARTTETIRVENPSDSAQYVIVERITSIDFRGPDNRIYRYNLNHPA